MEEKVSQYFLIESFSITNYEFNSFVARSAFKQSSVYLSNSICKLKKIYHLKFLKIIM